MVQSVIDGIQVIVQEEMTLTVIDGSVVAILETIGAPALNGIEPFLILSVLSGGGKAFHDALDGMILEDALGSTM